jgi:hypothetical protein
MNTLRIGNTEFRLVTDETSVNVPTAAGAVIKVNEQTGRYSGRGVVNVVEEIKRLYAVDSLKGYRLYYVTVTGNTNPSHLLNQVMLADPERIECSVKRAGMQDMTRLFKPLEQGQRSSRRGIAPAKELNHEKWTTAHVCRDTQDGTRTV